MTLSAASKPRPNRVVLPGLIAVEALALIVCCGWTAAGGADAVVLARLAIRITARFSYVFFLAAFLAGPLARVAPSAPTTALLRARREIGLAFAASHGLHLIAILALLKLDPALLARLTTPVSIVTGALAYLVIAAMAATSFRPAAAVIGARAWRILHLWGLWWLWLSFVVAYGKRATSAPGYGAATAIVLVAGLARIAIAVRTRARRGAS